MSGQGKWPDDLRIGQWSWPMTLMHQPERLSGATYRQGVMLVGMALHKSAWSGQGKWPDDFPIGQRSWPMTLMHQPEKLSGTPYSQGVGLCVWRCMTLPFKDLFLQASQHLQVLEDFERSI